MKMGEAHAKQLQRAAGAAPDPVRVPKPQAFAEGKKDCKLLGVDSGLSQDQVRSLHGYAATLNVLLRYRALELKGAAL